MNPESDGFVGNPTVFVDALALFPVVCLETEAIYRQLFPAHAVFKAVLTHEQRAA
jgi:hypothetical protein